MDWAGEKVLVIGGSGFLGANLIRFLVGEKCVPARNIRSFSDRASRALNDLLGLDVRSGDILDPAGVAEACKGRTLVFHAAGSTTFDPRSRERQWYVNVEGTRNVLEAVASSASIRRLCYTSTVNVLGCPWPEGSIGTESCDPYASRPKLHSFANPAEALALADAVHHGGARRGWWKRLRIAYFDSKLAAQELVNRAALEQGLDVVSVLPGTFFGPSDEFPAPRLFLTGVMENRIPGVPRGGLPLAHVHDVARGHALAVEKGRPGATYILGGFQEDNRRYADMMRIISEVVSEKEPGRKIRYRFREIPAPGAWSAAALAEAWAGIVGQPPVVTRQAIRASRRALFYSSARAEGELGYRAAKSFREAVGAMYDSLRRAVTDEVAPLRGAAP